MAHPTPVTLARPCPASVAGVDAAATDTVDDVMLRAPQVWGAATTVAEARDAFDDHVHAVLIVEHRALLAVLERADLHDADPGSAACAVGRLAGRLIAPTADADTTRLQMVAATRRRLAVVDDTGTLLGLLCLKRSGLGFCSDANVAARVANRTRAWRR